MGESESDVPVSITAAPVVFNEPPPQGQPQLHSVMSASSSIESQLNTVGTTTGASTSNNDKDDKKIVYLHRILGGLVVALLIVTGAVVGAVIATRKGDVASSSSSNSDIPAPGPPLDNASPDNSQPEINPTPAPYISTVPTTTADCEQQKGAVLDCASSKYTEGDLNVCLGCVSNISTYDSCPPDYCPDFFQCGCLFCEKLIEAWVECTSNCTINCNDNPAPTPAPTTTANACTAEKDTANTCLLSGLDIAEANACINCTIDAANIASVQSCSAFADDFCTDFSLCNCSNCNDVVVQVIDCLVSYSECGIQCGNTTNSSTIGGTCDSKASSYEDCINSELSFAQGNSCVDCVSAAFDVALSESTCSGFVSSFCPAFQQCSECGVCLATIEEWTNCDFVERYQCAVACGNSSTTPCYTEMSAYFGCLDNEMAGTQRYQCETCAKNAYRTSQSPLESCDGFNADFCPAFESCSCGSCSGEFIDYVDCLVVDAAGDGSSSCSVNCSDTNATTTECASDETAYETCLAAQLTASQTDSCTGCVTDAFRRASLVSCSLFESSFCPDFRLCNCGPCTDELEQYIECAIGSSCALDCASSNATTAYSNTRLCNDDSGEEQDGYQICLDLLVADGDDSVFEMASTTWSKKIVGDLPSVKSARYDTRYACSGYPDVIDDLYICGAYDNIDGSGGVLGQATFVYNRLNNSFPATGYMVFDNADVEFLKGEGTLQDVILHEMGHVIGVGSQWEMKGLIGTVDDGCPYKGINANREWQSLSGCQESTIPVEQEGGRGTACSHWDESCLQNELMTGALGTGTPIFSRLTVAALKDLGYSVNYSRAENFTAADINPSCLCNRRSLRDHQDGRAEVISVTDEPRRRRLSAEGYRIAQEHGRRHLLRMREMRRTRGTNELLDGVEFVGDKVVSVLYQEEGKIYSVRVVL